MLSDETGRRILRDRPRITSTSLLIDDLRSLPKDTVGRTYANWLDDYAMSPNVRDDVKFIDDEECAYVMQRYRECHDIYHAVLGIPPLIEGEVALKAFEFANTGLPMTALSIFAVARLKPQERRRFFTLHLPWAIRNGLNFKPVINIYWEKELVTNVNILLSRLGIEKPPNLREIRKKERLKNRAGRPLTT
jgi:ubiquinone biosynthesis protein COQ4